MVNNPPLAWIFSVASKDPEKLVHIQVQIQVPFFKYAFSNRYIEVCPYFTKRSLFKKKSNQKFF